MIILLGNCYKIWNCLCGYLCLDLAICCVLCHVVGYVFCLVNVYAISDVIGYGIWWDMSNAIGYTIGDNSIGYSIGYVTCNAYNISSAKPSLMLFALPKNLTFTWPLLVYLLFDYIWHYYKSLPSNSNI